jgi:UDP-N-acetylmuramyl pentapeptide phosphotransferase/UDP-N-acetylglucosamine-1-phosphate transferase
MGDVGSALLGFVLAATPLVADDSARPPAVVAVVMVWPFVFDAAFTLVRRARRGERLMQPHRSHLYQRLVASGWRHATVARLYLGLGACCAASGAAAPRVAVAVAALTAGTLWLTVARVERRAARATVTQPEPT